MHNWAYHRTGCHIYAPDRDVLREVRAVLRPEVRFSREDRDARHALYRGVLKCHHDARKLTQDFRL